MKASRTLTLTPAGVLPEYLRPRRTMRALLTRPPSRAWIKRLMGSPVRTLTDRARRAARAHGAGRPGCRGHDRGRSGRPAPPRPHAPDAPALGARWGAASPSRRIARQRLPSSRPHGACGPSDEAGRRRELWWAHSWVSPRLAAHRDHTPVSRTNRSKVSGSGSRPALLQSWELAEKAPWQGPDQAAIPNRSAMKAA